PTTAAIQRYLEALAVGSRLGHLKNRGAGRRVGADGGPAHLPPITITALRRYGGRRHSSRINAITVSITAPGGLWPELAGSLHSFWSNLSSHPAACPFAQPRG